MVANHKSTGLPFVLTEPLQFLLTFFCRYPVMSRSSWARLTVACPSSQQKTFSSSILVCRTCITWRNFCVTGTDFHSWCSSPLYFWFLINWRVMTATWKLLYDSLHPTICKGLCFGSVCVHHWEEGPILTGLILCYHCCWNIGGTVLMPQYTLSVNGTRKWMRVCTCMFEYYWVSYTKMGCWDTLGSTAIYGSWLYIFLFLVKALMHWQTFISGLRKLFLSGYRRHTQ